jgi:galactose oxidase-like protein/Kelch motif protein
VKREATRCILVLLGLASTVHVANGAPISLRPPIPSRAPTWTHLLPSTSPPPRAAQATAYDPVSRKVVMFGGFSGSAYLSDTWTFDGTSWTKQVPAVAPPARAAGSMAFDAVTNTVILFGGYNGSRYFGDTWIWDGATSSWKSALPSAPVSPPAVTGPAVFTDPLDGHADMFGGYDGSFYQAGTWQWTGSIWRRLNTSVEPYGRGSMVFGTDPKRRSTVIFGGLANANPDNTWTWNGVQWAQQFPSLQPALRYYSSAAYDPRLASVVVFGGANGGVDLSDTWTWNGTTWAQLFPTASPSARESFAMAYDAAAGHIVLFGGITGSTLFNDTWELTP